jgi:hypothetical protein
MRVENNDQAASPTQAHCSVSFYASASQKGRRPTPYFTPHVSQEPRASNRNARMQRLITRQSFLLSLRLTFLDSCREQGDKTRRRTNQYCSSWRSSVLYNVRSTTMRNERDSVRSHAKDNAPALAGRRITPTHLRMPAAELEDAANRRDGENRGRPQQDRCRRTTGRRRCASDHARPPPISRRRYGRCA